MRILFRGQLRSLEFCADHILGSTDFEVVAVPRPPYPACDIAVIDHPLLDRGLLGRRPALQVPQWLRQLRDLGGSWQQTVATIPTPLRKRIARMMGKHPFTVSLRPAEAVAGDFYERIYLPYVKHRFGSAAIVTGERAFMREARNAWLLELCLEGQRLGASLLRPQGDTLHLGRSALSLHNALSHAFDLLDYFCFLTAQLTGCRCLDFGLSRPHIEEADAWPLPQDRIGLRRLQHRCPPVNSPARAG